MKRIALSLLLLGFCTTLNALTKHDVFKSNTKTTWLGIDYSHVKFIGEFLKFTDTSGTYNPEVECKKYFTAWNRIVTNEKEKYNFNVALQKDEVDYSVGIMLKKNDDALIKDMKVYSPPKYQPEDISKFVGEYDYELAPKEGLGLLFLAECLDEIEDIGYFHFVVLDLSSQSVLFQKRLEGTPTGFGLRNYWIGSVYHIIKDIRKKLYKKWKKEVVGK